MLLVQRAHSLGQVHAAQFIILRHLANEQARIHGIFVAHVIARQITIAFFEAENESVDLAGIGKLGDDVADVFKAGKAATQLEAVFRSKRVNHGGRHDSRDRNLIGQILAAFTTHASDVIEQKHAHLVAREQRVVVAVFARHTHTVGIGIGREQQVGMHFLTQVNALLHGLANFRVGIRTRGKIAIGLALLRNYRDIGDARALEHGGHGNQARAIERRVHEFQGSFGDLLGGKAAHRFGQNRIVIALEHRVVDPFHHARSHSLIEAHRFHARERIGVRDRSRNGFRSLARNLATIGAIGLITVVGGRIVACRHANAT